MMERVGTGHSIINDRVLIMNDFRKLYHGLEHRARVARGGRSVAGGTAFGVAFEGGEGVGARPVRNSMIR